MLHCLAARAGTHPNVVAPQRLVGRQAEAAQGILQGGRAGRHNGQQARRHSVSMHCCCVRQMQQA